MPGAPAPLTAFDREVLLRRSAHAAHTAGAEPPFNLRPGLIGEILALYDELRRRHKTVADFDRLMTGTLESSAPYDRGAARLLAQTVFLTATFQAFERALAGGRRRRRARRARAGARVAASALSAPRRHRGGPGRRIAADSGRRISISSRGCRASTRSTSSPPRRCSGRATTSACTRACCPASRTFGFDALAGRLRPARCWSCPSTGARRGAAASLRVPRPGRGAGGVRPRAEVGAARHAARADGRRLPASAAVSLSGAPGLRGRAGAVPGAGRAAAGGGAVCRGGRSRLQRDRGGLHARRAGGAAAVPAPRVHRADGRRRSRSRTCTRSIATSSTRSTSGTRSGWLGRLVRTPHRAPAGVRVTRWTAAAGGRAGAAAPRPRADGAGADRRHPRVHRVARAAAGRRRTPGSRATSGPARPCSPRCRCSGTRTRRTIPAPLSISELSGAVRRWIDGQTFSPRLGAAGVMLLDASAAPYADVDEIRIVGLSEADWPERSARSIFYPQSLLAQLGWPGEQDRFPAARARFQDLLRLPRRRVSLSTFTLEDDAIVSPSPLLEEVDAAGLPIERLAGAPGRGRRSRASSCTRRWRSIPSRRPSCAARRRSGWRCGPRARSTTPRFRGQTGRARAVDVRRQPPRAVPRVPVQVLRRAHSQAARGARRTGVDDAAGARPSSCTRCSRASSPSGSGSATARSRRRTSPRRSRSSTPSPSSTSRRCPKAIARSSGRCSSARPRRPGSASAPSRSRSRTAFPSSSGCSSTSSKTPSRSRPTAGPRRVTLRSKADRIDLLQDGTLRIVDYKTGRAPEKKRSLQLPIYGVCAQQALEGRHGRSWTVSRAGYIAFKEKTPFTELQNPREGARRRPGRSC